MDNQDKYTRQYTKKEMLVFNYNKILERIVAYDIDTEYFERKAKTFKKDSPQATEALKESLSAKESRQFNQITLEVIESKLAKLAKEEKTKN